MPSSYTPNLGLEKPGSGEQTGTWGDTVNDNSDIADRAINGVLALTLAGTSSTLTTSDGTLSDGHYKMLVLGGTPGATHTVTLAPNDADKIYFVFNGTANSAIFTQGSGGDATVPAGGSAVIYADGAGTGAAVGNLTNTLAASSVKITGGTITGITDLAVADGGTGGSDAATARTNLGLVPGTDVQAYDAGLLSIAGLTTAADRMIYTTASNTYAVATLTAAGRALLDDANASAQRTTLGLGGLATLDVLDEDNMATNSATRPPSQQSVKAYVDAAAVTAGGVGSYVFAHRATATAYGASVAGSSLYPAGAIYSGIVSAGTAGALLDGFSLVGGVGTALSGTWMCLGTISVSSSVSTAGDPTGRYATPLAATIWLRTA
jgi:hypothetical protein